MKAGDTTLGKLREATTPSHYHHGNLRASLLVAADTLWMKPVPGPEQPDH